MKTIAERLLAPFPAEDIEWRIQSSGKAHNGFWARVIPYIQARAVQGRLDEVVGISGWKSRYRVHAEGILCALSLRMDGEWIAKEDGAEMTDIEAFKGGLSSALKRAASSWGIGRYLYDLQIEYATICDKQAKGAQWGQTKDKFEFFWLPPKLPAWALPENSRQANDASLKESLPAHESASAPLKGSVHSGSVVSPKPTLPSQSTPSTSPPESERLPTEAELDELSSLTLRCGWTRELVVDYTRKRWAKVPRMLPISSIFLLRGHLINNQRPAGSASK